MRLFPRLSTSPTEPQVGVAYAELMMRSLAVLFAIGGSLLMLAIWIGAHPQLAATVTAAAACYAMAAMLFVGRRRLPGWSVLLFLSIGSLLIEWVILRSGESATTYTLFYFWIAIYAFQYLRVWQAFLQLAFVFLSSAVVLGLFEEPTSLH